MAEPADARANLGKMLADVLHGAGAIVRDENVARGWARYVGVDGDAAVEALKAVASQWPTDSDLDALVKGDVLKLLAGVNRHIKQARQSEATHVLPGGDPPIQALLASEIGLWLRDQSPIAWLIGTALGFLDNRTLPVSKLLKFVEAPGEYLSTHLRDTPQGVHFLVVGLGSESVTTGLFAEPLPNEFTSPLIPPGLHSWLRVDIAIGAEAPDVIVGVEVAGSLTGTRPEAVLVEASIPAVTGGSLDLGGSFSLAAAKEGVAGFLVDSSGKVTPKADVPLQLTRRWPTGRDYVLLDKPQIKLSGPQFRAFADSRGVGVSFGFEKVRVAVKLEGILESLFGKDLAIEGPLRARVDSGGFNLEGGVGLKTTVSGGIEGPLLSVRALAIEVVPRGNDKPASISLNVSADVSLRLGSVLELTALGLGAGVTVTGDLEVKEATIKLRGLRVAIEVPGLLQGGGELEMNGAEIAGELSLYLSLGPVEIGVNAIGLFSSAEGHVSFIVVLSVEFQPAIEVFLGFTLEGVGGVFGFNRSMDLDVMRAANRSGDLVKLLFPSNTEAGAKAILPLLRSAFPDDEGQYVFGVMLKMGWGRPKPIVTATVGLVVTAPDPVRVALPGQLRVVLPRPELAIVDLRADFLGAVDLSTGEVSLDAEIRDSRIAFVSVTGSLGFLAGPQGFFLSVGGYHSRFVPPKAHAGLKRLQLTVVDSSVLKIWGSAFFALTPSTVQFGAAVEMRAEFGPIGARGGLSLEVLIQFAPKFGFAVHVKAFFALTFEGEDILSIHAELEVEGPGRWHVKGRVTIKILFISVSGSIDESWGAEELPPPVRVDVAARVRKALTEPTSLTAAVPADAQALATLSSAPGEGDQPLLVHPLATLRCSQRVAPLGRDLDRFGVAAIEGPRNLTVTSPGVPPDALAPAVDQFVKAEFFEIGEQQRLTEPPMGEFASGFVVKGSWAAGARACDTVMYEEVCGEEPFLVRGFGWNKPLLSLVAAARSGLRDEHLVASQVVEVQGPEFRLIDRATGILVNDAPDLAVSFERATMDPVNDYLVESWELLPA